MKKNYLAELREKLQVSQTDLSDYLGVTRGYFSNVEKNDRSLNAVANVRLAWLSNAVVNAEKQNNDSIQGSGAVNNEVTMHKANKLHEKLKYETGQLRFRVAAVKAAHESVEQSLRLLNAISPDGLHSEAEKRRFRKWKDVLIDHLQSAAEKYTTTLLDLEIRLAASKAAYTTVCNYLGISAKTPATVAKKEVKRIRSVR